jgi:enterochelin esterase-like enzyme
VRHKVRLGLGVLLAAVALCACGSEKKELAPAPRVSSFALQSKLIGKPLYEVLVTPAGGGKGRPLLVFLHGYGGSPSGTLDPAFIRALRSLGDRAPVVLLPEGEVGWWHDRDEGRWGSYVLREAIPAALARSGADRDRVAIGGISMGGFGALDIGRIAPKRFCAVGGHSPGVFERGSDDISFGFDNAADFARHDLIGIARRHSPYDAPVWIDVGDRDSLRPAVAKLARELEADDADVSFHVWPGAHESGYWDAHFAQYLDFYADACD